MSALLEVKVQAPLDRESIRDVVMRYCHGADRFDADVIRNVYWPEATDNHGVFKGLAKDYVPFFMQFANVMDQMQHLVGNVLIRVNGAGAACESYFFGYRRVRHPETGKPCDHIASGRYLDKLERRREEWRIIERDVVFDWQRNFEDSADWPLIIGGNQVTMGGRAPDDVGCKLFDGHSLTQAASLT